MLDAQTEIQRLRQSLKFKGFSDDMADAICDEASRDIGRVSSDILADAMNEAVNVGGDVMSVDFIEDIRAVRSGGSFEIITDSGKTDYSEPPFPMLPRLLKNAKVAWDGSLYKVIPIKSKDSNELLNESVAVTLDAAHRSINEARRAAKIERDALKDTGAKLSSMDPMANPTTLASMQSLNKARSKNIGKVDKKKNSGATINFRTASSKQDPNTQWVHPGRNVDVSSPLNSINTRMQESIDNAIRDIIRQYEDMY
jgi:hypothetical protein